jgi:photoactive yellow protein
VTETQAIDFADPALMPYLRRASAADLDLLGFGVIGFDADGVVRRYNQVESEMAGLALRQVIGHPLFAVVAPCMNNFMVAQRFEDVAAQGQALDETIDYVLTLRMRPAKVRLRLLADPDATHRYVLVHRAAPRTGRSA